MPPKRAPKGKLHELAVELPLKTIISDLTTKKQYCVGRQFATGGFGRIYTCNEVGSKTELVVKVEPYGNGPLFTEMNVFIRILKPDQISEFMKSRKLKRLGVPPMISSGIYTHGQDKLRFLVIPKYAISLEEIRSKSKILPASDVWTVARCMLESLEYIHEKNYTHADIKAANILLERKGDFASSGKCCFKCSCEDLPTLSVLVDFGLARLASSNEDKPDKKRAHNGTAIFTSCDAHRGCHPSYRGDLEILAYNMIYWLTGSLPWEDFEANPGKVYDMKEAFLKELQSNLKKLLKDNSESIAALQEIFSIARKTGYTEQLNFPKLYKLRLSKIVDEVLKRLSTGGRKRASEEPDDAVKVKRTKMKPREKASSSKEQIAPVKQQEPSDDVKEDKPFTPKAVRFRSKANPTSSNPAILRRQSRRVTSTVSSPAAGQSPSPSHQQPARRKRRSLLVLIDWMYDVCGRIFVWLLSETPTAAARDRHRVVNSVQSMHRRLPSSRRSARLASGEIVPGLLVTRAPCVRLNSESVSSKNDEDSRTPGEKKPAQKVSSDVKRSPTKLRMIPGMLNFQRGRRSIVIDQITKKYQRIAQKRRSSQHVSGDQ
ncbi:hypothetical protein ANCCAN_07018 [Ancylostoma caninum]|uniref:non-specific serine/threonine protein kinase n=1 Tax=Ancylostoma caninum TaxID=29170 RepID=A0A368GTQ6_ANCCA|nr:hypothetical protein ANCCAN_07018 [Ancylostoma caninum]